MASADLSKVDLPKGLKASGYKIAVVTSRWNSQITENLTKGCVDLLKQQDVGVIKQVWVPGSFELALAAQSMFEASNFDAVICIGCVIQGQTKHFDFVCQAVAQGLKDVSLKYNKPVVFGVLTDNTLQQSIDRSGGKLGNKGIEAAATALEMIYVQKSL